MDAIVGGMGSEASDGRNLTAMTVGALAFSTARLSAFSIFSNWTRCAGFSHFAGAGFGLVSEVAVFRMANQALQGERAGKWNEGSAFLQTLVDFGGMKIVGRVLRTQNFWSRHAASALSMMAGHSACEAFGLTPSSSENFSQRFAHAFASSVAMEAGALGMRMLTGNHLHQVEHSLQRSLQQRQGSLIEKKFELATEMSAQRSQQREATPLPLRPHQREAFASVLKAIAADQGPWYSVAMPMQTGKSHLTGPFARGLRERYKNCQVVVVSSSTVISDQILGDLQAEMPGESIGRLDGSHNDIQEVTVASIRSLANNLSSFNPRRKTVLIFDEAYSTQSQMHRDVIRYFGLGTVENVGGCSRLVPRRSKSNSLLIGYSGTGQGLEGYHPSYQLSLLDAVDAKLVRDMVPLRQLMKVESVEKKAPDQNMIWWKADEASAEKLAEVYMQQLGETRKTLVFVPTIEHARLLQTALQRKLVGQKARVVHSRLNEEDAALQGDIDYDEAIAQWREEGGPLISVKMLGRGFRPGEGLDAVFMTYQTSSLELAGQQIGRGWGIDSAAPGREKLTVLEAYWNPSSEYANLARLMGLNFYPREGFDPTRIREQVKKNREEEIQAEELNLKITLGEVSQMFWGVPVLRVWGDAFKNCVERARGLFPLSESSEIPLSRLLAYGFGALPVRLSDVEKLQAAGFEDAVAVWVRSWETLVGEVVQGRALQRRVEEALVEWIKADYTSIAAKANAINRILERYFPDPRGSRKNNGLSGVIELIREYAPVRVTDETLAEALVAQGVPEACLTEDAADRGALVNFKRWRFMEEEGGFEIEENRTLRRWERRIAEARLATRQAPAPYIDLVAELKISDRRIKVIEQYMRKRLALYYIKETRAQPRWERIPVDALSLNIEVVGNLRKYNRCGDMQTLLKRHYYDLPRETCKDVRNALAAYGLRLVNDEWQMTNAEVRELPLAERLDLSVSVFSTSFIFESYDYEFRHLGEMMGRDISKMPSERRDRFREDRAEINRRFGISSIEEADGQERAIIKAWRRPEIRRLLAENPLEETLRKVARSSRISLYDLRVGDLKRAGINLFEDMREDYCVGDAMAWFQENKLRDASFFDTRRYEKNFAAHGIDIHASLSSWRAPRYQLVDRDLAYTRDVARMMALPTEPEIFSQRVESLELSDEALDLIPAEVVFLGDLAAMTFPNLLAGNESNRPLVVEIRNALQARGLAFNMKVEGWQRPRLLDERALAALQLPVSSLHFINDVSHNLSALNILTIEQLVRLNREELLRLNVFDQARLNYIDDVLSQHGLHLGMVW